MFSQIILMLVDTVCGFLSMTLVVRFAMQSTRVSFRNPLGQFVMAVSNWMVLPARRFIPGAYGHDLASALLAWVWQLIYLLAAVALSAGFNGVSPAPTGIALIALLEVIKIALYFAFAVVFISAVFSWVNPHAPMAGIFNMLARPMLRPFQRFIPPIGGVDLSPLALFVLLQIALMLLANLRTQVILNF
ncbi:MAG: YggT family protein [Rhodocyclaceae bacterium]|nr:YggT family protein [Rhodocyclaceae bacterium]